MLRNLQGIDENVTIKPDANWTSGGYYVIKSANPISATVYSKARQKISSDLKSTSILSCVSSPAFISSLLRENYLDAWWNMSWHLLFQVPFLLCSKKRPFQMILTSRFLHARWTEAKVFILYHTQFYTPGTIWCQHKQQYNIYIQLAVL